MAHLMSVEKSRFIDENIKIFSENKVGQYSKFLDRNPVFVTYYHINQALSRTDAGTGGIEAEVGNRSPIRFNKILQFPLYNIPELKPDINFDETGYDIDLELSDIPLLPGTIKPTPGDYVLFEIPNTSKILFRVNNIGYNTIQSNDFYVISMDAKYTGEDVDRIDIDSTQVVETYQTIFENIGTQDRCFIRIDDIDNINRLVHAFYALRDRYKMDFYRNDVNSFLLETGRWTECGDSITLYDAYLEAFINKSKIFYDANSTESLVLTPNDILDPKFDSVFNRSLYNAILTQSALELTRYQYYYDTKVQKRYSTYQIHGYCTHSVKLFTSKFNIEPEESEDDATTVEDNKPIISEKVCNGEEWKSVNTATTANIYFPLNLIKAIKDNEEYTSDNYFLQIIYNYMKNIKTEISQEKLFEAYDENEEMTFRYMPLILYILTQIYKEYFHSGNALDLP